MKKHANTVKRTMIEIQTARFFHAHSFDLVRTDIMKIGSYPPGPLFNIHNKRFFASPKNTNIHTHTTDARTIRQNERVYLRKSQRILIK